MLQRFFDRLVEIWDWWRHALGFDRVNKRIRSEDTAGHGFFWRVGYFLRPLIALLIIIYIGTLTWRFAINRGEDLAYPKAVLTASAAAPQTAECPRSRMVDMSVDILDQLVNRNDWAPGTPQYKIGYFGLLSFAATPFYDNKASFQSGALSAVRRVGIEMNDTLGRVRGTSAADPDLGAARSALQWNETAWLVNFDGNQLVSTSAAGAYRDAMASFEAYNTSLGTCDSLFDARADNLFQLLDRIANDLGSTIDRLAKRSQGTRYDPKADVFVDAEGNNLGWFDMRADNIFSEARGQMYAYHGLLQAARVDFADTIQNRGLDAIWDLMEQHVAEAAVLSPLIISNGREDGFLMPDHLSVMAENMLRARTNIVEIREILDR